MTIRTNLNNNEVALGPLVSPYNTNIATKSLPISPSTLNKSLTPLLSSMVVIGVTLSL